MKNSSKIYFLFTSIMMLIPPLSLGLSFIYFEKQRDNIDIVGLIINCVLIFILGIIVTLLVGTSKISKPKRKDIMLLLFGFFSNVIIFLFVFQHPLKIEDIIDIYISTIVILLLYFLFVNRKYFNIELWILSVIYFAFYRFHIEFVYNKIFISNEMTISLRILYSSIPLITLAVFSVKIYKYKIIDWFSGSFICLTGISLLYLLEVVERDNKLFMTVFLIMPFLMIIDFIVSKINKSFKINKLPFYMRLTVIVLLIVIFRSSRYFIMSSYRNEELYHYTFIMYAIILINIIEYFVNSRKKVLEVDDENINKNYI